MSIGDTSVTRRDFLQGGAAGLATLAVGAKAQKPAKKPNILWIMSDEHNHRVTGCYGNKTVQTPNMDALAASGVTFDTHYCNSPLYVPSRASLTACKYVSRIETWNNSCEIADANIPSLPRVLNAAGYQSYLCGKQHYDYSRRYGFIEWGGNFNNNYKTGLGKRDDPNKLTEKRLSQRYEQFHPGDESGILNHDRRVTAGAVDFFNKMPSGNTPFFLYVGYLAPHFPLIVPDEYYERYKGKIPMPEIPEGFLDSLSLNYKVQRASFQEIGVPDDTVRRGRELYYGLTSWGDNEMGKVLAALRARPEVAENTLIVYASDHGENMGEHGMWWKNCMFEQASRVPLIISFPKRWKSGQRRVGASSHVDLVQTLVEFGGGKAPGDWNGTSMMSWLDEPKHKWKDMAVSEYYGHATASNYSMIRMGDWKYVYHSTIDADHPEQRELYNIKTDMQEFHNVAAVPANAARVAGMHKRLLAEVASNPNDTEQRCRKEIAVGYQRKDPPPPGAAMGSDA